MYRLPEKKSKRPASWKQLAPSCSRPECTTSGLSGVFHRHSGYWLNEQQWFCSADCLEQSLELELLHHFNLGHRSAPIRTTMPLGLMMLARGVITDLQLRDALQLQQATGDPIGACLQHMGFVSYQDIASAVATQWGCPVFPADSVQPGCSMLIPFSLAERYRMLPVHLVTQGRRLFVAFSDRVNHSALIAIEHMLGCESEACIIPEPSLFQVLEYRKRDTSGEAAVHRPGTAAETARMIRSYAHQSGSEALRLQAIDGNIWVRFLSSRSHLDLIFDTTP